MKMKLSISILCLCHMSMWVYVIRLLTISRIISYHESESESFYHIISISDQTNAYHCHHHINLTLNILWISKSKLQLVKLGVFFLLFHFMSRWFRTWLLIVGWWSVIHDCNDNDLIWINLDCQTRYWLLTGRSMTWNSDGIELLPWTTELPRLGVLGGTWPGPACAQASQGGSFEK